MLAKLRIFTVAIIILLLYHTKTITMHLLPTKKETPKMSFMGVLKYLFLDQKTDCDKLATIKSDINILINLLKNIDKKKECIDKKDVEQCKQLWDAFLTLHNYYWLDRILYRYQPDILSKDTALYRRNQLFLLHPDKCKFSNDNNDQYREDLFKYITDIDRPIKPLDFIVNPISNFITPIGIRASMQATATVCSLPSLLFPNYFKNKESLHLEKLIKKENIEFTQYNIAIKDLDIEIKDYNNAIKVAEFRNKMYQQEIKDILKSLN